MDEKNRNLGPLVIILLILALAVLGYRYEKGDFPFAKERIVPSEDFTDGRVVKGFPSFLLGVSKDEKVVESLHYVNADSKDVLRVTVTSSAPNSELYSAYLNLLQNNGYIISGNSNNIDTSTILANKNSQMRVEVRISVLNRGVTQVLINVENL